ncbi:uncharacterized protein PHACADRAFT_264858 [Phanerochaete carnosa HHB-10118-sp]|uniref:Uncharacterized protein n=1 Tax=Phanerochaete carnosa (strain HHB-10118-sp) TaxID=650164 RepID=K5WJ14_PHACS|nr:uncharacterized protein PHACADRAFT_264858 [Phanerochaete carnosa HHB-10118-sp]EKM50237.1 hypothetical protein PHACADRAFT_264858 [Phanerochaete carnosa HHB-10118-sp]
MLSALTLLSALCLPFLAQASPTLEARCDAPSRAGQGSICSTKGFDIESMFNEMLGADNKLTPPVAEYPTFVALSVGYQNYSCLDNGTYFNIGAVTELFDISCLPMESVPDFTTFVSNFWEAAGEGVSPQEVINIATQGVSSNFSLGIHYWIPSPLDPTNPLAINSVWDFSQQRLMNDPNVKNAFVVGGDTAMVPSPDNATFDAPWISSAAIVVNGTQDGMLADQIYRIHSNDGNFPVGNCTPGQPDTLVKSTLNFWMYGGAWADTIF